MSCEIINKNNKQTVDLIFQADNEGYDLDELQRISELVDLVKSFITNTGTWDIKQDLIAIRVGTPTVEYSLDANGNMVENHAALSNEVYTRNFPGNTILRKSGAVDIDYIKVTERTRNEKGGYTNNYNMYSYQSNFIHKIFGNYFKQGVYNATNPQLAYINNLDLRGVKSPIGIVPVQYGGVLGLPTSKFFSIPEEVLDLIVLVMQNIYLFASFSNQKVEKSYLDRVIVGDKYVNTLEGFMQALDRVKATCEDRISRFSNMQGVGDYFDDIREIFKFTELDKSFKDLRYGGAIDTARLLIRVEGSYANEKALRDLLKAGENFEEIFPVEIVDGGVSGYSAKDLKDNKTRYNELYDKDLVIDALNRRVNNKAINYDDLYLINDWYDTKYRLHDTINVTPPSLADSSKGGRYVTGSVTQFRTFRVNDEWFRQQPAYVQAGLLITGLDLFTEADPCPFDQVIAIVLAIVLAYFGMPEAGASILQWTIWIAATILSVGSAMGIIKGEFATKLQILLAILTLGRNLVNASVTTMTEILKLSIKTLADALTIVDGIDQLKFNRELEQYEKDLEEAGKEAEMYESNLRFSYEGAYEGPIRNSAEADPYKYAKDDYNPFSTYKSEGFMDNGFARPLTYGWG